MRVSKVAICTLAALGSGGLTHKDSSSPNPSPLTPEAKASDIAVAANTATPTLTPSLVEPETLSAKQLTADPSAGLRSRGEGTYEASQREGAKAKVSQVSAKREEKNLSSMKEEISPSSDLPVANSEISASVGKTLRPPIPPLPMESKVESLVSEILEAEALIPDKSRPKSWTAASNDSTFAIADDEESPRATDESESAAAIALNEQARQPESAKSQGSEVRSQGEESSLSHLVSRLKPSSFVPDRTATPPIGDDASDRVNAATQKPTSVTYPNAELLNPPKEAKPVDVPPPAQALVSAPEVHESSVEYASRASSPMDTRYAIAQTPNSKARVDKEPKRSLSSPTSYQDEAYILGAGDRIGIDIFKVPEYSKEYQVLVDGSLNLPLIGKVAVKGMTLKQAGDRIAANYNRFLQNPLVTLSLLAPRPLSIGISGEVNRPGAYTIPLTEGTKFPRVTQVIQLAGGITQAANLRGVQLLRPQRNGSAQVIFINLWALLQTGDLGQDLTLRDGDTLFIPTTTDINLAEAPQLAAANFSATTPRPVNIAVVGSVSRPGPYTITKGGETGGLPTVTQAIQQAGGITPAADVRRVQVRRATRSGEQIISVDLWQLLQAGDGRQDLILQQGDTVVIPTATAMNPEEALQLAAASFSPATMKVNVVGEVAKPGGVEVPPNTPLNQALLAAGGFNNRARKSSVQLIRLNPNGTVERRSVSVDLARGISEKENPILHNNDVIVVGRSGTTQFSDAVDSVLNPLGRILPLFRLF